MSELLMTAATFFAIPFAILGGTGAGVALMVWLVGLAMK